MTYKCRLRLGRSSCDSDGAQKLVVYVSNRAL
jgi:hypothetical protein